MIASKVFEEIAKGCCHDFHCSMPGDTVPIHLSIVNHSDYEYHYKEGSVHLSTKNLDTSDYIKKGEVFGFDGQNIDYDSEENLITFTGFRTLNKPLQELFGGKGKKKEITDEAVGDKLKEKGYSGIEELNKYYLDYYNTQLEEKVTKLEDLPLKDIVSIFNGSTGYIKETNEELKQLNYNFFYNELFAITFGNQEYDAKDSSIYTIGSYMRDKSTINSIFNESFHTLSIDGSSKNLSMYMHINGPYTTNAYQNYVYHAYMDYGLEREVKKEEPVKEEEKKEEPVKEEEKKEEEEIKEVGDMTGEEDIIIPPHTGV